MSLPSKRSIQDTSSQDSPSVDQHKIFVLSNGSKLHSFPREEVPYAFAYNREVLELAALDHALLVKIRDTQTFIDFKSKGQSPKRCLDLGTALGDWVVDTAQRYPECTFVGFDLVDVQIRLEVLEPSVAKRIQWVHGNFLTRRLPFTVNEFDYIHLQGVALAVPEDKWHWLFGELHRVLKPGGFIEMLEQDALFPTLPRWFTDPLHAHLEQRTPILPGRERQASLPRVSAKLPHVHALLEELFYGVFDSRFINPTPSSILPDYFATMFRHVLSPPILRFPMPPIPPLIPRAEESFPPPNAVPHEITSDPLNPFAEFIPSPYEPDLLAGSDEPLSQPSAEVNSAARSAPPSARQSIDSTTSSTATHTSGISTDDLNAHHEPHRRRSVAMLTPATTSIGDETASALIPIEKMAALPSENLYMHLYQALHMVLAVKEAMWDELKRRVVAKDPTLELHGWEKGNYELGPSREKFDALLDRYRGDMQMRISLWHSLVKAGWPMPQREPLTNLELDEEERLRQAVLEARKDAKEEEFITPTRSFRLLLGVKE